MKDLKSKTWTSAIKKVNLLFRKTWTFIFTHEWIFLLLGKMWTSGYGIIKLPILNFHDLKSELRFLNEHLRNIYELAKVLEK